MILLRKTSQKKEKFLSWRVVVKIVLSLPTLFYWALWSYCCCQYYNTKLVSYAANAFSWKRSSKSRLSLSPALIAFLSFSSSKKGNWMAIFSYRPRSCSLLIAEIKRIVMKRKKKIAKTDLHWWFWIHGCPHWEKGAWRQQLWVCRHDLRPLAFWCSFQCRNCLH